MASVSALVLILLVIPALMLFYKPYSPTNMVKDGHLKSGKHVFNNFLQQIKDENGLLILGTSETGNIMDGENYYHLLDKDKSLNRNVYPLGGAGRNANVYFPLILNNPEAFKDLQIVFYLNPTYWRQGLNEFSKAYFDRYVDKDLVRHIKDRAIEKGLYERFLSPVQGVSKRHGFEYELTERIERYKSLYSTNLSNFIQGKNRVTTDKIDLDNYLTAEKKNELTEEVNQDYNVSHEFLLKEAAFPMIDSNSTYQDELLIAFIQLAKSVDIELTIYLGPYNAVYCKKMNPELIDSYEDEIRHIKSILTSEAVPYIDGTDLSYITGTFNDVQHISKYGAYLTAKQIRDYVKK